MSMIELNNLSFSYAGAARPALQNITMQIEKGEFIGIIGESGAGKSTLSYVLNGIIPHHYKGDFYGSAVVDGMDSFEHTPSEIAHIIGSVLQDVDSQMLTNIVEDELLFGLENFGIPHEEIEARISDTLEKTGISHLRYRNINSLSGGQKQKVAIAAILALRPQVVVLDEPTGELDPAASRQIFQLLRELNTKYNITVIVIEQKIMLLCEYAKRLAVMSKGNILYDDSVAEVLKHSDALEEIGIHCPRTVSLSKALYKRGLTDGALALTVTEAAKLVYDCLPKMPLIPSLPQDRAPQPVPENPAPYIQFQNVSFGYGRQNILQDISFTIHPGEFVAVVGPNGAGKSTLSKHFNGLLKPTGGRVCIKGLDTRTTKISTLSRHIGFLFQNPDRQICKNTIACEIRFGLSLLYREKQDKAEIEKRVQSILTEFGFSPDADPFSLSRGERQRLALASLLAVKPEILLLDEPTTGLDYQECIQIMEQIRLLNQAGVTIIMVCHDMELVLDYAKRILVLSDGEIIADGTAQEIFHNRPLLEKASLLPPQIMDITSLLKTDYSVDYTDYDTIDALAAAIEESCLTQTKEDIAI